MSRSSAPGTRAIISSVEAPGTGGQLALAANGGLGCRNAGGGGCGQRWHYTASESEEHDQDGPIGKATFLYSFLILYIHPFFVTA